MLLTTSTSTTPAEESSSTSPAKDTSTPPESEVAALTATLSVDPGLWPDVINDETHCQIVRNGPVQIVDFDFPKNAEVPLRRFTKDNYKITMKNGEKSRGHGFCIL